MRRAPTGTIIATLLGACLLGACASTATSPANRPIPDAPAFETQARAVTPSTGAPASMQATETGSSEFGGPKIVIAANTEGVGAGWTSITQNPMAGPVAELSNLGGPVTVIGAVGAIVALDAAPKGRAARTARAVNAGVDMGELDASLAEGLEAELDDIEAEVDVRTIERSRDLPEDAYVLTTDYTIATDGSAVRVRSNLRHSDLIRYVEQLEGANKRLQLAREGFGTYDLRREQRRLDKARKRLLRKRRFAGAYVYHSDPIALPDTGDLPEEELREDMRARLVAALDVERAAQYKRADDAYEAYLAEETSEKRQRRAEKRRAKAYAKADALYAKSLEKAGDDEFGKMERMVLGVEQWVGADGGDTLIAETLAEAQAFIIDAIADGLESGVIVEEGAKPDAVVDGEPVQTLQTQADGRSIVRVVDGPNAGTVMSVPEFGIADYGGSTQVVN